MVKTMSPRPVRVGDQGKIDIAARVHALDWASLAGALDAHGCATTGALLSPAECVSLRDLYLADDPFRSRIIMARHGFGRGEYKYFRYPLPKLVDPLARGPLPAVGADRQWLERCDGHQRALSRQPRQLPFPLSCSRSDEAHASSAAIRCGRLQLPAPGRLW